MLPNDGDDGFWTDLFKDFEPAAFPDLTGRSASARKGLRGYSVIERKPGISLRDLERGVHALESNLTCVLQAAWSKVLAAYLGETDLSLGCTLDLVEAPERVERCGFDETRFLPTRITLDPKGSNERLLRDIQSTWGQVSARQPPDSTTIKSILQGDDCPLYDTALILQCQNTTHLSHDSLQRASLPLCLQVICNITDNTLCFILHCQRSLILENDTHHVLAAFEGALTSLVHQPSSPCLSWSTEDDLPTSSVYNPNPKPVSTPHGSLVHEYFEYYAGKQPDAMSLHFLKDDATSTKWSFFTLNRHADRIADMLLILHNINIEDAIPICIPKSPEFYASVLGVLKAGGCFTPFDPQSPADRKSFMLNELAAKVVLFADGVDMSWCSDVATVSISEVIQGSADGLSSGLPSIRPGIKGSNLAYRMYTSGSTGRPKAVSVEHQNAVQTACASRSLLPWKPQSRMLQYSAPTFDMCYYDTFLSWTLGICLCSASSASVFNDLMGTINLLEVTMLGLTPSVALTLDPEKIPSVDWMYCIGEALAQSLVDSWEGKLVNSYGPTEATQMVTIFPVRRYTKSVVIGKPFDNTSFTVLQKNSNAIAPIFGLGELCIGGFQLARGYYKNEERSNAAFIDLNGVRMYRSGDNVRMLADGNVEFIGRLDDQVKIRGQRVELGEINSVLQSAHPSVTKVSTQILTASDQAKDQLVTFLVVDSNQEDIHEAAIRQVLEKHAAEQMPSYMVPKSFLFVDSIPLSAAGKVDKRVLTSIFRGSDQVAPREGTAPAKDGSWTENEAIVRDVLSDVSGVGKEQIGGNTSIYQLGLDSISAIHVAARLKMNGNKLTATDVLTHPTPSDLASILVDDGTPEKKDGEDKADFDFAGFDQRHRSQICDDNGIDTLSVAAVRPCTALQMGMIAQSIHTSGKRYYLHSTYEIPPKMDLDRLRSAWEIVVEKHELMRTGFASVKESDTSFAMVTYRARSIIPPVDIAKDGLPNLREWQISPEHDLSKDMLKPPWKVLLEPTKMHFSAHHSVFDAQTLEIILHDLTLAYDGSRLSPPVPLEPHLSHIIQASDVGRGTSAEFWKSFGKDLPATKFPITTPLWVASTAHWVATRTCHASRRNLDAGCRKSGVTMQAAAQASWGQLLAAYVGEEVVTFGTVLSGRSSEGTEDLGLPCITTVPTSVNIKQTNEDICQGLMKFNAEVQKHQNVPLTKIQRLTGHAEESLFDTVFTYQKYGANSSAEMRFKLLNYDIEVDYTISVELEPVDEEHLQFRLVYRQDHLAIEQAALLLEQLDLVFSSVLFDGAPSSYPTIREADPLLFSIDPAKQPFIDSECRLLHEHVRRTASETPHKVALEFALEITDSGIEKKTWTYEELERESNRVASMLQDRKVEPHSIVAFCLDKCPEASFTMLGISKAGCTFLALDPGAPADRKRFILEDSQAALLITKGSPTPSFASEANVPAIDFDQIGLGEYASEAPSLLHPIDDSAVAYCLYTSGTTGTPKGCALTHRNVSQALLAFQHLYTWDEKSRWLQFASYHFDVSVMEHFWSWSVGITVVTASRDLVFQDLTGTIRDLQISHLDLTPSLARVLNPTDVPILAKGVFVTGGEMLKTEIIETWGETKAIHNAYGPTEATIGCTMYCRVPKDGRPSNIGSAFPNAGTFVVNPENPQQPVLRGAVGELCVSGVLVAKGYLNRPELTEQKFIDIAGQRCYRTGDLVRIMHGGSFDFLGRADSQVKLRGQRLETLEIDSVLKQRDRNVLDVATQVLKHPKQQKAQLVSFVVLRENESKTDKPLMAFKDPPRRLLQDLRTACTEKLPGYMVPTFIIPLTSLPLSANNKVDARQLKLLYEGSSIETIQRFSNDNHSDDHVAAAPDEDIQKIIALLSKVADADSEEMSPSSSIYKLGLDSISVIGFARSLKKAGYSKASTSLVMRNSTVARLTQALCENGKAEQSSEDGPVQAARQSIAACQHRFKGYAASALSVKQSDIVSIAPCTPLQQGIITRSLEKSRGMYFTEFDFDLESHVDLARLREACERVQSNVQILRAKFLPTEDGYIQVVVRETTLPWTEMEVEANELNKHLETKHEQWWSDNQSLISDPFQILISKTSEGTIMSLFIFHALYDGNSLPLLMQTMLAEYYQREAVDYGPDFKEALPFGPLQESRRGQPFWTNHLKLMGEIQQPHLPALVLDTAEEDTVVTSEIEPLDGFEECRRRLNVTHQAIVQACWAAVLQDAVASPLILGMVISGRSIDFEGAEKVIGPLFNTVPFFLAVNEADSWKRLIQRCHEFNVAAQLYQHTPLRDIQKWTRHNRSGGAALFESLFVFQRLFPSQENYDHIWKPHEDSYEADYPLSFDVEQTLDGGFKLTLLTQAHISNKDASTALLTKFGGTLRHLIEDVTEPLSESFDVSRFALQGQPKTLEANGNGNVNGDGNGHANGREDVTAHSKGTKHEEWTEQALKVRDEIASLADADPGILTVGTSILELGLDSIDAVKLSSRLRKSLGVQVAVSAIMRSPTIGGIASVASICTGSQQKPEKQEVSSYDLRLELRQYLEGTGRDLSDIESILPTTPLQEGMIAEMLKSDLARYLNHDILRLRSDTDVKKLQEAWQEVVDGTPVLRTLFVEVDDPQLPTAVAQVVMRPHAIDWRESTTRDDDRFDSILEDTRRVVVDTIREQPPFRLTLVRDLNGTITHLIISLSHAMYDGWSLSLMHDDVQKAYIGDFNPHPPYEPALTKILSASSEQSEIFWKDSLSDMMPTIFPTRERAGFSSQTVHRKEVISSLSASAVQKFCKSSRTTMAALCQTVWSFVLASAAKQLDVAYGVVLSGRDDETANDVLFPTMNTVISRAILYGSRKEMVRYMQDNISSISEHQHFPLRKAQALARSGRQGDLFNTLFIYQKRPGDNAQQKERLYESVGGEADVEFPVCVEAEVVGDQLIWRTACKAECLTADGVSKLLDDLKSVVEGIVRSPEEPVVEFSSGKTSICGLRPFREADPKHSSDENKECEASADDSEWSSIEQKLRLVVAEVAKVDREEVNKQSTLLSLGLDSISAIKVSSLLRKQSVKISVNTMLKAGTISRMAEEASVQHLPFDTNASGDAGGQASLQELLKAYDLPKLVRDEGLQEGSIEQCLPATAGQVYLLSRWQNTGLFYQNLKSEVRACNNVGAIRKAWSALVAQTPILRTVFVSTGDNKVPIIQAILKDRSADIVEVPQNQELDTFINRRESSRKQAAPSAPAKLFIQHSAEENTSFHLAVRLHHALYDGFSLPMLYSSLGGLLNNPSSLPPNHYFDFSMFLKQTTYPDPSKDPRRYFWQNYLADFQNQSLPISPSNEKNTRISLVKPSVHSNVPALIHYARNNRLSTQSLFLAVYASIHASLTMAKDPSDVLIGVYIANRAIEGADELQAPTLGFVPIRVRDPVRRDVLEIARDIQNDLRSISEESRGSVGIWQLSEWLGEEIKVDVWVNLLRTEGDALGGEVGGDGEVKLLPSAERRVDVEKTFQMAPGGEDKSNGLCLGCNAVRDNYGPAIDVEAAIRKDSLDIGVQAPVSLLDMEQAKGLVEKLMKRLEELARSTE